MRSPDYEDEHDKELQREIAAKDDAASVMLAALKAVEELFPKAPPPAIAQKATENFRRFQLVRAAIKQAEAAGIKSGEG